MKKTIFLFFMVGVIAMQAQFTKCPYFIIKGGYGRGSIQYDMEYGRTSILGYAGGYNFLSNLTLDNEFGVQNDHWMLGLENQNLFTVENWYLNIHIRLGNNYLRRQDYFFGNFIAVGMWSYASLFDNLAWSPYFATGVYLSKKHLVCALDFREYVYDAYRSHYLFNAFSINLTMGYRFDF